MEIIINLPPRTKKNSQEIVSIWENGKKIQILIQSKAYRKYEKDCGYLIPKKYRVGIDYPVNVKCIFYMPSYRKVDKSNLEEAIHDILVKYNVLVDDNRDIIASTDGSRVFYDKKNPRTEIVISKIENYEQWENKKLKC